MTEEAQRLLDLIVEQINSGRFIPGKPEKYLGYKEVHVLLHLPQKGATWGRSLKVQGLNDLAEWVNQERVPAVTGLIIDTTRNNRPGNGYFKAFNNINEDDDWWHEEVRRSIGFDWSQYSNVEALPTRDQLDRYDTRYTEGKVHEVDFQTRRRCEALIRRIKSLFRDEDGELKCELCGWSRPSTTLSGEIIEIHHLCPKSSLPVEGIQWTLEEALKNLRPLCPNCHRIAHAKPGGGTFSLEELREIVKK